KIMRNPDDDAEEGCGCWFLIASAVIVVVIIFMLVL
ncbi:unnamed protein product, partial [marine sediment metagenome]